jgi:hypothetical protein
MNNAALVAVVILITALCLAAAVALGLAYRRGVHRWLLPYFLGGSRTLARAGANADVHVVLCIADHYEPHNGKVGDDVARRRVRNWLDSYPRLLGDFRDSDGRPPRHTFFYPLEQYDAWEVDSLVQLCRLGYGEVEVHHHHDRDSSARLRARLTDYKEMLSTRHELLPRRRGTGETAYAFVHGDWALDNSRPDGRCCGVNDELDVLRETGCYADFTLPSAPSPTQTSKINSIYYACDDPCRPRSHDTGIDVGHAPRPDRALMIIQGPLMLNWRRRKWGILPRIDNANLQRGQPPTEQRLDLWLRAGIRVATRPDWFFVKLHTHGAPEENQDVLLGPAMVEFHKSLSRRAAADRRFYFHYVTAREMYNLIRAAEAGWMGSVNDARDYELVWPPQPATTSTLAQPDAGSRNVTGRV